VNGLDDALRELVRAVVREEIAPAHGRRWGDIESVADYLGVSVSRVRYFRERGMPAKRIGKRLLFDLHAVDEWLERQP
jgi:excisionase family DNA binding protein